jgi:hypothetical protein
MWKAADGSGLSRCFGMIDHQYIEDRYRLQQSIVAFNRGLTPDQSPSGESARATPRPETSGSPLRRYAAKLPTKALPCGAFSSS